MRIFVQLLLIATIFSTFVNSLQSRNRKYPRGRRSPSSFQLAYLQKHFEDREEILPENIPVGQPRGSSSNVRRDEVVSDTKCLQRCNNRLNIGMDMVNAHMAFGSIDVPSVMEASDLDLFCMLDYQHSQCIDDCGYSVQFNLREYICKNRLSEMKRHLSCYAKSAPILSRHCRPRCGGYKPLEHSLVGYAARCRQLLCDHTCIDFLLQRICGQQRGQQASAFLLDFTRLQIAYWIREYSRQHSLTLEQAYPASCSRIQCNGFDPNNCTLKLTCSSGNKNCREQ